MRRVTVAIIRFWRLGISLVLPPSCRFYPSCSAYAETAIERFGVVRGAFMGLRRIGRCHPWERGGFDPVPDCEPRNCLGRAARAHAPGSDLG